MKSAGRETPSASWVIGSVDVFEPSSASGREVRLDLREDLRLDGRVLEDGLDHEVGARGVSRVGGRRDPREQRVGLLLGGAPARDRLVDERLRVALAALGGLGGDVLQHDVDAGLGADVGDRGAHHARAQHDDLGRLERRDVGGPATVPVDLLQVEEERLDHVLGDLARDEVDEVAPLDLAGGVEVDLRALDGRGHDVVRRRVVRALELLAQVGREGRQVLRELRVRRRAAGDLVALDVPGLDDRIPTRLGFNPRLGGRDELLARGDDLVDDADLLGLRRLQALALQQQLHQRVDDADHAHAAHDAAGAGEQAELHLGEADDRAWVVDDHAVVRGQADLQAAAERRAVDGGDDRLAQGLQAAQQRLALAHELRDLRGVLLARGAQVVEVPAGEERLLGGGDDDAGDRVLLGLQALDGRGHRGGVGRVHGVRGLVGVVEGQDDDAA